MRNLIVSFVALLSLSGEAAASFAELPLGAALAQAEVVVVGTLQKPRGVPRPTRRVIYDYSAEIKVHRQLAGPALGNGRCTLTWIGGGVPSGGVGHRSRVGVKGIWLLRRSPRGKGRFVADHPAAFRPIGELAAVEAAIRSPLYLLDDRAWTEGGKACCITLEIRTFQPRLVVRDFVSVARGKLRLHGKAWLEVQGQTGKPLGPRPGAIVHVAQGSVVVTPERPHRVTVDLRKAYDLRRRGFREVFHIEWGSSPIQRSPSYVFEL